MDNTPWFREEQRAADLPLWREALCARELAGLHLSPVFYGRGVPRGDGAAVVLVPGFLLPDAYLAEMRAWLRRLGYRACASGIRWNADCPNLLVNKQLRQALEQAREDSGGAPVHLIGHSLGGLMARAIAAQRPEDVASVVTLGSPFRGADAHPAVLRTTQAVRRKILGRGQPGVLPECYTGRCGCEFMQALRAGLPAGVPQTAIYTRSDGIVDWRSCVTGDARLDVEVRGTHLGLPFNAAVYRVVAHRLAAAGGGG
jgi:pimeloyl-ACP methyl ester carboxylesterase